MSRECVEDLRKTRRHPDFGIQLRIESALEEMPFTYVRTIAEATHTAATIVLHILTEILTLTFLHWR
jgi:hypothetical protein